MHFISCKTIWLDIATFFCLWHVKRTWQKQACIKIKYQTLSSIVLQELGNIMYDKDGPSGTSVEMWAMNRLQYIISKYPITNVFWRKIGDISLTCGWLDFKIYHMLGKTRML
jgi:hypothetical protein